MQVFHVQGCGVSFCMRCSNIVSVSCGVARECVSGECVSGECVRGEGVSGEYVRVH